jgi:hypothetical protein
VASMSVPISYRGSRKHVLDWIEQPGFPEDLLDLVQPVRCIRTLDTIWEPLGTRDPREPRLETFGPKAFPGHPAWGRLNAWWLKHARGNTPNWDIAMRAEVEGRPGLILVEAKANVPELNVVGKSLGADASEKSQDNHEQIRRAIDEARIALSPSLPGISISTEKHYQLSNRIAFAWRLASLGIPTVLLYLGFTADTGIWEVGAPFVDAAHWRKVFQEHLAGVCATSILDERVRVGPADFWVLARSRPVLQVSPLRRARS